MKPVTTKALGPELQKSLRALLGDAAASMGLSLEIWKSARRPPERLALAPACRACEREKPRLFDRCRKRRTYLARPEPKRPTEVAEKCSLGLRLASIRPSSDAPVLFAFGYGTLLKEQGRHDERVLSWLRDVQRLLSTPDVASQTASSKGPGGHALQLLRTVTRDQTCSDETRTTIGSILTRLCRSSHACCSLVWVPERGLLQLSLAGRAPDRVHSDERETWQALARELAQNQVPKGARPRWKSLRSNHPIERLLPGPCEFMAVPLGTEGILGVLRTGSRESEREDTFLLGSMAQQVDLALRMDELGAERHRFVTRTVRGLVAALDARVAEEAGHSERVQHLCMWMAREMDLSREDHEALYWGSLLHDIGKTSVPDAILRKVGRLDRAETEIMNEHPIRGWEILCGVPELAGAADVIRSHHERWDGTGYPEGLAGEEIPRPARILAVADAFDAILAGRTPDRAQTVQEALETLEAESAQQFDPQVLAVLRGLLPRLEQHAWILLLGPGLAGDAFSFS